LELKQIFFLDQNLKTHVESPVFELKFINLHHWKATTVLYNLVKSELTNITSEKSAAPKRFEKRHFFWREFHHLNNRGQHKTI